MTRQIPESTVQFVHSFPRPLPRVSPLKRPHVLDCLIEASDFAHFRRMKTDLLAHGLNRWEIYFIGILIASRRFGRQTLDGMELINGMVLQCHQPILSAIRIGRDGRMLQTRLFAATEEIKCDH